VYYIAITIHRELLNFNEVQCGQENKMKKAQAFAEIMALKGVQPIKKIIDILLSIDNFKSDTINKLNKAESYDGPTVSMDEIYVDLTYQRKLKLQALINRLINYGGFDKDVAGHIDLAVRTDGRKFVWDGFHRAIMAGLCGLTGIPAAIFKHDKTMESHNQLMKEAKMFKVRNADQTSMRPEEIFKSEVVFRDPTALQILGLLKECKLDVEGTNEDGDARSLGGFAIVRKTWDKIHKRHFIDSSNIIFDVWPKDKTVSVILWCGLAKLLEANDNDSAVKSLTLSEIKDSIKSYVKSLNLNQSHFTQPRLHGKAVESTATNVIKYANLPYNDNGNEVKSLITYLGIDEDELYIPYEEEDDEEVVEITS